MCQKRKYSKKQRSILPQQYSSLMKSFNNSNLWDYSSTFSLGLGLLTDLNNLSNLRFATGAINQSIGIIQNSDLVFSRMMKPLGLLGNDRELLRMPLMNPKLIGVDCFPAGIKTAFEINKFIDSYSTILNSISDVNLIARQFKLTSGMFDNCLFSLPNDLSRISKIISNHFRETFHDASCTSENIEDAAQEIQAEIDELVSNNSLTIVQYVEAFVESIKKHLKSPSAQNVFLTVLFWFVGNFAWWAIERRLETHCSLIQNAKANQAVTETRIAIHKDQNLNKELISNYRLVKYWSSGKASKRPGSPQIICLGPGTIVRVIERQKKWSIVECKEMETDKIMILFVRSKYLVPIWK
ncbi:hypothetical protein [Gimesia sp.]|uniref:hypothetical protein n=1 Tax=Gimesia sp. TaxID=2024833 RepID=UPI0032EAFEED